MKLSSRRVVSDRVGWVITGLIIVALIVALILTPATPDPFHFNIP